MCGVFLQSTNEWRFLTKGMYSHNLPQSQIRMISVQQIRNCLWISTGMVPQSVTFWRNLYSLILVSIAVNKANDFCLEVLVGVKGESSNFMGMSKKKKLKPR